MNKLVTILGAILVAVLLQTQVGANIVYIETSRGGTDGELSGNNLNPTAVGTFTLGVNSVRGRVQNALNDKPDIFSFVVPAGHSLNTMVLSEFTSVTQAIFIALDNGPTFAYDQFEINNNNPFPDISQLMGATVVGTSLIGQDALVRLAESATNNGGSGFARPLTAGTYTMYIQETNANPSDYTFTFNIVAVPEPSSFLMLTGIVATVGPWMVLRKRRRSSNRTHHLHG